MKIKLFALLLLLAPCIFAQEQQPTNEEIVINEYVTGSLMLPPSVENPPLVVIIGGSGPTDRDGNQAFMKNDSYKKLAKAIWEQGIASFRYDKRVLQAQKLGLAEGDMRFEDFVTDASSVIEYFKNQGGFGKIIVLGHSQGSLVGMLAAKDQADALISVAGAGQPIDSIVVDQVAQQMPGLVENTRQAFAEMRETGSSSSYNPLMSSIFRPSVQPFLLSWMQYDPAVEIAKLDFPVLIINGTNDFQVSEAEAQLLAAARPEAELVLIEDMNHVLKEIVGDDTLTNSKSYNEPNLPLHPELVPIITAFIQELK